MSSSVTQARAKVAGLSRLRAQSDPVLVNARRDLDVAKAEAYIQRLVDAAPPLTASQRERLTALLRRTLRRRLDATTNLTDLEG